MPCPSHKNIRLKARYYETKKISLRSNFELKGTIFVVLISLDEKNYIAERLPDVHIRRTVQQKSKRHRYYMEESRSAMKMLWRLRNPDAVDKPRGDRHGRA